MDGAAAPSELNPRATAAGRTACGGGGGGHVRFEVATAGHDAGLRQLLRENPMGGQVRLSLEREPSYFVASAVEGDEHRTIAAVEDGRVICAGSVSSRMRYVNGRPTRVGYLGGLRLDAGARGRTSIVLRGYALFRELHERHGGPPLYLTSIAADNVAARRLLERGLNGMPTYHALGDLVTLVIPRRPVADRTIPHAVHDAAEVERPPVEADVSQLVMLLTVQSRQQFAPAWSAADLCSPARCPNLSPAGMHVLRDDQGAPIACAALWDQRPFKQTVVRRYAPALRRLRPLINAAAMILRRPRLPAVGRAVAHAYVSHLAADPSRPELTERLVRVLRSCAAARRIDFLTLGLDARDPRLPHLRRAFRPREYVTRLYAVHWDDGAAAARQIDPTLLFAPEVATL
jgi:hypothetical protein